MKIFLCSLLCVTMQSSYGADCSCIDGDTIAAKPWMLTQNQFMETYGQDDSSRALINFYFHKRNRSKAVTLAGASLALASGIALGPAANHAERQADRPADRVGYDLFNGDYALVIGLSLVMTSGLALFSSGLPLWLISSRKKLLRLITAYQNGQGLPRRIAGNIMFRGYLLYNDWNRDIRDQLKSAERLRIRNERKRIIKNRLSTPQNL